MTVPPTPPGGLDALGIPTGLVDLGSWGLLVTVVAFVFVSIFRGWIIVKLHYDTLLKRCETAEASVVTLLATNATQAQAIERQTAVGDTVERVMNSVQEARTHGGAP